MSASPAEDTRSTDIDLEATFDVAMRALFHPQRLALVGATPRPSFVNYIHNALNNSGYAGQLFGVTPNHAEVLGAPCYPTLDAIPGGVDAAVVVVPSHLVLDVLGQAERAGVKALNIISSGFGEQDDDEARGRQTAVRDFARRTGIRIVGPNCLGLISTPAKMIAMSGPYERVHRGPIGIVFQSGLLAYSAVIPPTDREFGYSYIVTCGNEADLDATDFMRYCVEDDETRVVGCFIEQFRSPAKLLRVAEQAAERRKPLVVLKVGRSEGGQRAALAHTGSLVGSDAIADAVLRQLGVIRVHSLDEMIETLAICQAGKLPRGDGVGATFVSGGASGLAADTALDIGVRLPALAPETTARLKAVVPAYGSVGNPLDTTGQAATQPEITEGCLVGLAEDPNIDIVVYGQAYPATIDLDTPVGAVIETMPERYPDKLFVVMSLVTGKVQSPKRMGKPQSRPVMALGGMPLLQSLENGLRAVRSLIDYAAYLRERDTAPRVQAQASPHAEAARQLLRDAGGRPLVERDAKRVLALYDIPVTREELATDAEQAVSAAQRIGYPVVLKIESPDIAHKTEAGGVLLSINDDDAVRDGYARIMQSAAAYAPNAALHGVLVQELAPRGTELILGMSQDPSFGPAVAVGLGGVLVEVLKDVQLGVPPLAERDARRMLARLRGRSILDGVRGAPPADVDEVVRIISRFGQLSIDLRDDVAEIDINPLVVFEQGHGATVVDCLIVPTRARTHA
jgi:acyl-CoA synthetase (NDP forming)